MKSDYEKAFEIIKKDIRYKDVDDFQINGFLNNLLFNSENNLSQYINEIEDDKEVKYEG